MRCPKCGSNTSVTDSRHRTGNITYRHRVCEKCGYGFATHETVYNRSTDRERKNTREKVIDVVRALKAIDIGELEQI